MVTAEEGECDVYSGVHRMVLVAFGMSLLHSGCSWDHDGLQYMMCNEC